MVVKRFKVLENRFRKNPEFFQMYKKQIDDYIKLGHAKLLSKEEFSDFSKKTIYLTMALRTLIAWNCPIIFQSISEV